MVLGNAQRLSKLAKEFNVGIQTIVEFLHKKGIEVNPNPITKVSEDACLLLEKEYKSDVKVKRDAEKITLRQQRPKKEVITLDDIPAKDEPDEDYPDEFFEIRELKKTAAAAAATAAPSERKVKKTKQHEEIPREAFIKPFKIVTKVDINDLPGMKKKSSEKPEEKSVPKATPGSVKSGRKQLLPKRNKLLKKFCLPKSMSRFLGNKRLLP